MKNWIYKDLVVTANTKSEARAQIKKEMTLGNTKKAWKKVKLPVGLKLQPQT